MLVNRIFCLLVTIEFNIDSLGVLYVIPAVAKHFAFFAIAFSTGNSAKSEGIQRV